MQLTLKQIYDEESKNVKFDEALAKRISKFLGDLMNRNEAHVLFFGSNLTGVYPLRFKTSDRNEWFIDIKDIDEFKIEDRIQKQSTLPKDWVRATDAFNLDLMYTMHRFLISDLPQRKKQEAVNNTAMVLNIKLLGSIMAAFFKYDVDERIAQEVYARLSRKFYIKKYGNWRKVLEHRSADITAPKTKSDAKNDWLKVLTAFATDADLAQCISDIQGRLRSMIKYVWDVLAVVKADDSKFNHTSMAIETGGEKIVQDLKRDPDIYKRYCLKQVLDESSFIKPELVTIVAAEMRTMSSALLMDVLKYSVHEANNVNKTNYKSKESSLVYNRVEELIDQTVEYTINVVQSDRAAYRNIHDLSWLLNRIKLLLTAAKTTDPLVLNIRKLTEELVKESVKTKNPTLIASVKTGLALYIVARTFSMKHYT